MSDDINQPNCNEIVSSVALRGEAWWHDSDNSMREAVHKLRVSTSVKTWIGDVAIQAWTEGAITAVQEYGDEMQNFDKEFDHLWEIDMRAVNAWRAAHPGNDRVLPDLTQMLDWLLSHVDTPTERTPND